MEEILKQEYIITSEFNEKLTLDSLKTQLSSLIFRELISNEKEALKLTFIISIDDSGDN